MAKLSKSTLRKLLRPGSKRRTHPAGAHGLYLLVHPTGAGTWKMAYSRPGARARTTLSLGSVDPANREFDATPEIGAPHTLAAALAHAGEIRHLVARGHDPLAEHEARRARSRAAADAADGASYPALARVYIKRHAKPNTRRWRFTCRTLGLDPTHDALPIIAGSVADRWRNRAAAAIAKTDVVTEMDRAVDRAPTAGNHLLVHLRGMFRWHVRRGALASSPCEVLSLPVSPKKLRRSHRLSDDELRWLDRALTEAVAAGEIPIAYAGMVRILTLTLVRRDEARCMTERELSADGMTWIVPGARTKNHLDHLVPLSEAACTLLAGLPRVAGKAGYLFSINGETPIGGLSKWREKIDNRMIALAKQEQGQNALVRPWRLHDLRRCGRSFLSQVTSPDIAERCLGHVPDVLRQVYDAHTYQAEKRYALALWADELARVVRGEPAVFLDKRGPAARPLI